MPWRPSCCDSVCTAASAPTPTPCNSRVSAPGLHVFVFSFGDLTFSTGQLQPRRARVCCWAAASITSGPARRGLARLAYYPGGPRMMRALAGLAALAALAGSRRRVPLNALPGVASAGRDFRAAEGLGRGLGPPSPSRRGLRGRGVMPNTNMPLHRENLLCMYRPAAIFAPF